MHLALLLMAIRWAVGLMASAASPMQLVLEALRRVIDDRPWVAVVTLAAAIIGLAPLP